MATQAAPPDWYPDPSSAAELRYWDGRSWTAGVATDGVVSEKPIASPDWASPRHLPARAALLAGAGAVVGMALGLGLALSAVALTDGPIVPTTAGLIGLWTGLLGACLAASRRWGTGQIGADLGLRVEAADTILGFGLAGVARLVGVVLVTPLLLIDDRFGLVRAGPLEGARGDVLGVLVLGLFMVVGAPVVEELFFRGLLQQSLVPALGPVLAVGVQSLVFGLAHVNPAFGKANATVFLITAAGGVVFGAAAHRCGRLGPSIIGHAAFNTLPVVLVLLST